MTKVRPLWTTVMIMLGALSCVPATTELHPKGGFSVHLLPSPATAGKPFTTADGWTITFEETALRPIVYASSGKFRPPKPVITSSSNDIRVMAPSASCELRLTKMDVGDAVIKLDLDLGAPSSGRDFATDRPCGLDAATVARIESRADDSPYSTTEPYSQDSANVGFVARAEKNGRTVHLSLFVNTWNTAEGVFVRNQLAVTAVEANKGVPVNFGIYFESIFLPDKSGKQVPAPPFDLIASADADGDGNVTIDELRSVLSCGNANTDGAPDSNCYDLFGLLGARMAYVIAVPDAPEVFDPSANADYEYSGDDDDLARQVGDKL